MMFPNASVSKYISISIITTIFLLLCTSPFSSLVVDCNDPGTPFKGSRSLSATTYSSEVTYQCDDGYVLQGSTRRRCQADGSWSENLPSCELVDCGDPGVPNNGFKTGASYKFGSKVTYRCNTGYELSGPEMRMCQSDGQWSGTLPSCVGKSTA